MQTVVHPLDEFACDIHPDRATGFVLLAGALDFGLAGDLARAEREG